MNNCKTFSIAGTKRQYYGIRRRFGDETDNPPTIHQERFYVRDDNPSWKKHTPPQVYPGNFVLTDVAVNDKNEDLFYLSLGHLNYMNPGVDRVLEGQFNNGTNTVTWTDMSRGLSEMAVASIVYQKGSDDILYAATDDGVYRWDKTLPNTPVNGCWVKFNDALGGGVIPNMLTNDLEIDYCRGKLVAATYGRGIWETDLYMSNSIMGVTTEINSDQTWGSTNPLVNTNQYLEGSIRIKSGNTLTINGVRTGFNSNTNINMPFMGAIYIEKEKPCKWCKNYQLMQKLVWDCS
ncbi:MAG: hypothetical protein IPN26_16215 [Bacteroidetes bacterium]|nr:hypothetical protein [Bacteroidota bacterium]